MKVWKIAVLVLFFANVNAFSHEYTSVTCLAECPSGGSLWIGTSGEGIFRLDRNGSIKRFSKSSGDLECDDIAAMGFDIDKVLWILEATGNLFRFTSETGFQKLLTFPESVIAASFNANATKLYFSTADSSLFCFDLASGTLGEPMELSSGITSFFPSLEDSLMWGVTPDGILMISDNGAVLSWDESMSDSGFMPFKFDTNVPHDTVEAWNNRKMTVVIVAIILIIIAVIILHRFLFYGHFPKHNITISHTPIVEIDESSNNPEPSLTSASCTPGTTEAASSRARIPINNIVPEPKDPGKFTLVVMDLIRENLSNPDFDVDSIAAMTGLSRIHVNRKLKSEGSPSPSILLKDARMTFAAKLLKQGRLSVKEVGFSCGFRRPSYFATAFKEYFNVSPSDYQGAVEA